MSSQRRCRRSVVCSTLSNWPPLALLHHSRCADVQWRLPRCPSQPLGRSVEASTLSRSTMWTFSGAFHVVHVDNIDDSDVQWCLPRCPSRQQGCSVVWSTLSTWTTGNRMTMSSTRRIGELNSICCKRTCVRWPSDGIPIEFSKVLTATMMTIRTLN